MSAYTSSSQRNGFNRSKSSEDSNVNHFWNNSDEIWDDSTESFPPVQPKFYTKETFSKPRTFNEGNRNNYKRSDGRQSSRNVGNREKKQWSGDRTESRRSQNLLPRSQRNSECSTQSESSWSDYSQRRFEMPAPPPAVNVWELRRAKMEERAQIQPHNDLEEDSMLQQALLLSKLQVMEDEKERKEQQIREMDDLNHAMEDSRHTTRVSGVDDGYNSATKLQGNNHSSNDTGSSSWNADSNPWKSKGRPKLSHEDSNFEFQGAKPKHKYLCGDDDISKSVSVAQLSSLRPNEDDGLGEDVKMPGLEKKSQSVYDKKSYNENANQSCHASIKKSKDNDETWRDAEIPSNRLKNYGNQKNTGESWRVKEFKSASAVSPNFQVDDGIWGDDETAITGDGNRNQHAVKKITVGNDDASWLTKERKSVNSSSSYTRDNDVGCDDVASSVRHEKNSNEVACVMKNTSAMGDNAVPLARERKSKIAVSSGIYVDDGIWGDQSKNDEHASKENASWNVDKHKLTNAMPSKVYGGDEVWDNVFSAQTKSLYNSGERMEFYKDVNQDSGYSKSCVTHGDSVCKNTANANNKDEQKHVLTNDNFYMTSCSQVENGSGDILSTKDYFSANKNDLKLGERKSIDDLLQPQNLIKDETSDCFKENVGNQCAKLMRNNFLVDSNWTAEMPSVNSERNAVSSRDNIKSLIYEEAKGFNKNSMKFLERKGADACESKSVASKNLISQEESVVLISAPILSRVGGNIKDAMLNVQEWLSDNANLEAEERESAVISTKSDVDEASVPNSYIVEPSVFELPTNVSNPAIDEINSALEAMNQQTAVPPLYNLPYMASCGAPLTPQMSMPMNPSMLNTPLMMSPLMYPSQQFVPILYQLQALQTFYMNQGVPVSPAFSPAMSGMCSIPGMNAMPIPNNFNAMSGIPESMSPMLGVSSNINPLLGMSVPNQLPQASSFMPMEQTLPSPLMVGLPVASQQENSLYAKEPLSQTKILPPPGMPSMIASQSNLPDGQDFMKQRSMDKDPNMENFVGIAPPRPAKKVQEIENIRQPRQAFADVYPFLKLPNASKGTQGPK